MIIVSGTMRSGTSLWMQVLAAGGFEYMGERFPKPWGDQLRPANPHGFFESAFVAGVHAATNPHPVSGAYLFPEETRDTVVKVFVPGLIRSDMAFIDRVIATVRPLRQVVVSMRRLSDMQSDVERMPVELSPALTWWMENFSLIRDVGIRRYAAHVTSYARLLENPEREISTVFRWLGRGDVAAATEVIEPSLASPEEPDVEVDLHPSHLIVFDELYAQIHRGADLTPSFVRKLNQTDRELQPRLLDARERLRADLLRRLTFDPSVSSDVARA